MSVFVGDEVLLNVGFGSARAKLARLAKGGLLLSTSDDAYEYGTVGLARVGAGGLFKVVRVQTHELAEAGGSARWAIRWEAAGAGGRLFPVLDADISLTPAGDQATLLTLTGSYRPPFGPVGAALDRALLHRVAAATVRNFLAGVAARITSQPGPAEAVPTGTGSSPPPGRTRSLLARAVPIMWCRWAGQVRAAALPHGRSERSRGFHGSCRPARPGPRRCARAPARPERRLRPAG